MVPAPAGRAPRSSAGARGRTDPPPVRPAVHRVDRGTGPQPALGRRAAGRGTRPVRAGPTSRPGRSDGGLGRIAFPRALSRRADSVGSRGPAAASGTRHPAVTATQDAARRGRPVDPGAWGGCDGGWGRTDAGKSPAAVIHFAPDSGRSGQVSEWLKEPVSKTGKGATPSRVRIPPCPLLAPQSLSSTISPVAIDPFD